MRQAKMDAYGLKEARTASEESKDPSTKVGACILRPDGTVASKGWNGFPRGIEDTEERLNNREIKYDLMIHGEMNALLNGRESFRGYTLYLHPFLSCVRCTVHVIQAGIVRVVAPICHDPETRKRWDASWEKALELYAEAGVEVVLV